MYLFQAVTVGSMANLNARIQSIIASRECGNGLRRRFLAKLRRVPIRLGSRRRNLIIPASAEGF
jgi:hypothetical protein